MAWWHLPIKNGRSLPNWSSCNSNHWRDSKVIMSNPWTKRMNKNVPFSFVSSWSLQGHPAYLTTVDSWSELRTWHLVFTVVVLCDETGEGPMTKASFYSLEPDAVTKNMLSSAFVRWICSAHTAPCDMRGTPAIVINEDRASKVEMLGTQADVNPEK